MNKQHTHYIHKYRQLAGYATACANHSSPLYRYSTINIKTNIYNNIRFHRSDYDTYYKTNIQISIFFDHLHQNMFHS